MVLVPKTAVVIGTGKIRCRLSGAIYQEPQNIEFLLTVTCTIIGNRTWHEMPHIKNQYEFHSYLVGVS